MSKSEHYIIGIYAPKYGEYLEVMFRTAQTFGARSIFTINSQWSSYSTPNAAKRKAERYPPYTYYQTFVEFEKENLQLGGSELVIVETRTMSDDAQPPELYIHPEKAAYLFIGRDCVLPDEIKQKASAIIKVSDDHLLEPGVSGSILLYDRHYKKIRNNT